MLFRRAQWSGRVARRLWRIASSMTPVDTGYLEVETRWAWSRRSGDMCRYRCRCRRPPGSRCDHVACACYASHGGGGLLPEEKQSSHKLAPFLVACTIVTVYCVEADVGLPVYAAAPFDVRRGSHACQRQSAPMWKQRCSWTGVAGTTIPREIPGPNGCCDMACPS
jgi:hypothetical protein